MSTRPTLDKRGVTRLEDDDLYEISFRYPGMCKTAKKPMISMSKRPSQWTLKSVVESSSKTSIEDTVMICRTVELIEGSTVGPIDLDSDSHSIAEVTEISYALSSSAQEPLIRPKVSTPPPLLSESTLRHPIWKLQRTGKSWLRGLDKQLSILINFYLIKLWK